MHPPFFWLIAGLAAASVIFAVRLIIKAQRRAKLERATGAVNEERVATPPDIG